VRSDLPQLQWLHRLTAQAGDAGRGRGERQAAAEREGRLGMGCVNPRAERAPQLTALKFYRSSMGHVYKPANERVPNSQAYKFYGSSMGHVPS